MGGSGGGQEGPLEGEGSSINKILSQLLLFNMNMLCFKFHKNHTINEEFDLWWVFARLRGAGRDPISKI